MWVLFNNIIYQLDFELIIKNYSDRLAYDIASKIEEEMEYPGQIKITVIREVRKIAYAK